MTALSRRSPVRAAFYVSVLGAAIFVVALIIWQGVTAHGTPDPMQPDTSSAVATMDIGILVFREGLECILVLAAITASMTGRDQVHRRPVAMGAGMAFLATLITWFMAVRIVGHLTESVPALDLQAATGLLAIIVLLVIMNWFFHRIYWGGWIRAHNRRKKALFANSNGQSSRRSLFWGLILLGFTSLYREGFEVVLFLQSYNLQLGGGVVLKGALLGLFLSGIVAVLTFVLQKRLPYRKMLITTGILLGVVLLVMVGEEAQEMQLAHWISTTDISWLANAVPTWMGMWFAVFPTYETIVAQLLAAILVVGSYYAAAHVRRRVRADSSDLANATEASSSLRRPLSRRTLKDRSLVSCPRQNAPSLQIADCIAAGEGQRQSLQTRQRVPQFGQVCR
jgi:high-affinity iron transporter